jgi:hypothetical protein
VAIYRPRRSRWPLLLGGAVACLVIGALIGAVVVGSRPPDLTGAATTIRETLGDSAGLLEVVQIEYNEAVAPGGGAVELQGAVDNLDRSRARYDTVAQAVAALDRARASRIDAGFTDVRSLLDTRADPSAVGGAIEQLRAELLPD